MKKQEHSVGLCSLPFVTDMMVASYYVGGKIVESAILNDFEALILIQLIDLANDK